jgi:peptide methionine sulfoxide reductase MsrB
MIMGLSACALLSPASHPSEQQIRLEVVPEVAFNFPFNPFAKKWAAPVVVGTEDMMSQKKFGTSAVPIQTDLRWNCDVKTADKICNYNRHYAEYGGYWERTSFLDEESAASGEITFYDSNTGKPLFYGPKDRTFASFVAESQVHGWPSFRDSEVNWDFVRVLPNGECISVDGTHLGHNLPDRTGNRYCINLVSVAGRPAEELQAAKTSEGN